MAKFYPLLALALILLGINANAQAPTFTITFPGGECVPAPVQFENTTTGISSLTWTIDASGGGTVTDNSPTTIQSYGVAGTYNVTLTVTYGSGSTASATQSFTLTTAPVINTLTASPLAGCAPLNSCFGSTVSGGTPGYSYIWDFCDGDSSTSANPCHTYTTQGCYCYTLVVTDANGCITDSAVFQSDPNAVCVTAPPTACFTSPNASNCSAPLCVNFVNCSTPATGLTYAWSFPGGVPSSSTLQTPPCINYTTAGTYGVTLTVTDANGCSNTMTVANFVNVGTATTCINNLPATVCSGQTVTPDACGASTYNWTIAPMPSATSGWTITGANTQTPTINFTNTGTAAATYTVTLNVTIPGGCTATATQVVTVNPIPQASFTVTNNIANCAPPLTVTVTNTSVPLTLPAASYVWSFPGGSPSSYTGINPPTINYTTCGQFTITLVVTGSGGCSDTAVQQNIVQINCVTSQVAIGNILIPEGLRCPPVTVPFVATVIGGTPPYTGYTFNWNFNYNPSSPSFPEANLGPTPSWTFTAAGCYNVAVQIIGPGGCTSVAVISQPFALGSLQGADPLAATIAPSPACASDQITITIDSDPIVPPPALCCPVTYKVHWGDGGTSIGPGPSFNHMYNDTAIVDCFDVTVVRMSCACHDTLELIDVVCIFPPIAELVLSRPGCDSSNCIIADASGSIGADFFDWGETLATLPVGTTVSYEPGPPTSNAAGVANAIATFCFPNINTPYTFTVWAHNVAYNCSMDASGSLATTTPVADFTLGPNPICVGGVMNLVNLAQGNPAQAIWKIYDSNTGALVATSFQGAFCTGGTVGTIGCGPNSTPFNVPGCYDVQFITKSVTGCYDTITKYDFCDYGVKANFTALPKQGCAPLTVNFQDSTIEYGIYGMAASYAWDFGDPSSGAANTSTLENPSHTYNQSGYYDVTLCVNSMTNGLACQSCTTKTQYIHVSDPQVTIAAIDPVICAGGSVCFTSILTGATLPYTYDWDFGDLSPSDTFANPCHTYVSNGNYDVNVTVIDAFGCIGTDTLSGVIDVGSIDADFTALSDTATSCPPLLASFQITATGIDTSAGSGWSWLWYFGDSQPPIAGIPAQPFHAYTTAGTFDVTLILTSPNGCTDTLVKEDYIFVGGPTANATATIDTFCPPQQVCFDANPSNSISFLWCFGDNTTCIQGPDTGPQYGTICHTYDSAGVFESTVLLCDDIGCCYELPVAIIVSDSVKSNYTATSVDICNNGSVTLCDSSSTLTTISSLQWSINDSPPVSSTDSCITHTFNTFGTYDVTHIATSITGCIDTTVFSVIVTPTPVLNTITNSQALCPGDSILFGSDVTSVSPIDSFIWTFQGGTPATSSDSTPYVVFNTEGIHTVTLKVIADNGCWDSTSLDININPAPVADAGLDKSACANDSVVLGPATGGISFTWTPGPLPQVANPSVLPPVTTTYTLVVTDANGCTGTDQAVVFVGNPPTPGIAGPDSLCANATGTLTGSGGVSYAWTDNFGTPLPSLASITVTPSATTTYTVVVTAANNCSADTTHVITVIPLPIATLLPDSDVCAGSEVLLTATGGDEYAWSSNPVAALTPPVNPSVNAVTAQIDVTTEITVDVMQNGCTTTIVDTIFALAAPPADAGPDDGVCINDSIQLNGSGGVIYEWILAVGDTVYDQDPVVDPVVQTTYILTVTDGNGCTATDQVVITVNPLPTPSIVGVDTSCSEADLVLTGGGGVSYVWSTGDSTNPLIDNPIASTTYYVTVTDANGCENDTSKFVEILALPIANAEPDTAVCMNQPIQLFADSGFVAYDWTPVPPLNNAGIFNPIATISDTTTFVVTVTDWFGCENEDSVFVTMLPLPNVEATPMLPYSCGGDPVLITVVGGITYVWTDGNEFITAGSMLGYYTATPPNTDTFVVQGTDANGCVNMDTVQIEVMHPFVSTFTADTCVCYGDCAQLTAQPDTIGFEYTWTPTTALDTPNIARPTTCTTYDITYQVIVFDGRCYSDTGLINVCVNPLPTVHAGNDTLILAGSQAYLVASTDSGIGTYEWFPDSLVDCALCQSTLADPEYITTYFVVLTDENGCRDGDSMVVDVFCSDASIYIPNAFTPDGDGLNDEYHLRGAGFSLNFFRIYNRWGEKVFETNNLEEGWNGMYKGKMYEPEVFVYYLEAVCSSGELLAKKGNITLIR